MEKKNIGIFSASEFSLIFAGYSEMDNEEKVIKLAYQAGFKSRYIAKNKSATLIICHKS